jgi:hypothetical protein
MPAPGWPTVAELATALGGVTTDTHLENAHAAALADALYYGIPAGTVTPGDDTGEPPTDPVITDAAVYEAVLGLGVNWYQDRNRRDSYADQGPFAINAPSRYKCIAVIMRGTVAIS